MRAPFDLFKRDRDGDFVWLEATADLRTAKNRLKELSAKVPGEYLVFDQTSAQIIERTETGSVRPS
jgi:hypothetical protein